MNLILFNISILKIGMTIVWAGLLLCSIVMLAVVIERFIYFQRLKIKEQSFVEKVSSFISAGNLKEAAVFCEAVGSPLSNIIKPALTCDSANVHEKMLAQAGREIVAIERFVSSLSTISTVSPLLGLLGTIFGMIEAFAVIAVQGTGQSEALANGISNALLTTAAGLIVAIPAVIMYNYFVNRVNASISNMENVSNNIAEDIININNNNNQLKS